MLDDIIRGTLMTQIFMIGADDGGGCGFWVGGWMYDDSVQIKCVFLPTYLSMVKKLIAPTVDTI